MTIPTHPLADCWPMIEGDDAEQLRADIAANGLHERITILDGQILDGRNRHRACVAAGVLADELPPDGDDLWLSHYRRFNPEQDGDPKTFVISKNEHRRHLTLGQRAMVAAKLESYGHGGKRARDDSEQDANLQLARSDVAEQLNVSPRSVASAKTVIERGAPELVRAVEQNEMPVSLGEEIAKKPITEQLEILRNNVDPKALRTRMRELRQQTVIDKKVRRVERERELAAKQAALPDRKYGVILTDDEWEHAAWSDSGMLKAASNHYPTSSIDRLKERDVEGLAARDAVYFMWTTVPHLALAIELMAHRGFAYKSNCIWRKIYPGDRHGMGYWFWIDHEILLVGTRGNVPAPAPGTQWPSIIEAPVGAHSEKPEKFYELIEAYFPNLPKIELNARTRRPGWDAWGLEAPDDAAPGHEPQLDQQGEGNGALPEPIKHTRASAEPILKARYDGSNAAELAADLGVPVGTLRTWLFRCGLTDRARIVARGAAMVSEFNREKHNAE